MKTTLKSLCAATAAILATTANAAVPGSVTQFTPNMMNYQGHLYDAANYSDYTEGTYDIQCRIYASETGGTPLWGGRYSVYVKNGYFNIMLGDSSGSNVSGTTYKNNQIWMALWENNDLWLGVTVEQDYMHNPISSSSQREFTPRQRLLAGPYAFRAQAAQYANEALGDFRVGGDIRFTTNPWTIGGRFKCAGDFLTIGVVDDTTPTGASPAVKVAGSNFTVNTYGSMWFKTTSGNVNIQAPSKSVTVTDGDFAVESSSTASLKAGGSELNLDGTAVRGKGDFRWTEFGKSESLAPFVMKTVTLSIPAGSKVATVVIDNENVSSHPYRYVLAGNWVSVGSTDYFEGAFVGQRDNKWVVRALLSQNATANTAVNVHVLGIHKSFASDLRSALTIY